MSVTVAHRTHIHLPWKSIAIFLGAAAVAVVVLVLINQPRETARESASMSTGATAEQPFVGSHLKQARTMLRSHVGVGKAGVSAGIGASATGEASKKNVVSPQRGLIRGTTPDGQGTYVPQPPAPWYAPGTVDNAHPLNLTGSAWR